MARRFRRKQDERRIALGRIGHLFDLARRRLTEGDRASAVRSVRLGRRIAMRYQTGLPKELRDRYCRGCEGPLMPGQTARIRVRSGMVRTTCLACGETQRRPFLAEQKARRLARHEARHSTASEQATDPIPITR